MGEPVTAGTLCIVEDASILAEVAAQRIADEIALALTRSPRASLALSGGSTPGPAYERLAGLAVAWDRVDLFLADERCVPPDDPRSNHRLVRERLLDHLPADRPRVRRMEGERADHAAAARDYEALLPERLDVVVLGMGEDAHAASLFPGSPALLERERRVLAVQAPTPPVARISLAPRALEQARSIVVLVSGRHKAAALARAREGGFDPSRCPVQIALRGTWIGDRDAASALSRTGGTAR